MPLSVCTITGTAYYANGTLGDANIYITADQISLNGAVIGTAAQTFYAEPVGGIITLILPRGSTARLFGNVRGFHTEAVVVAIPDTPTANLEDLIPVQYSGSLPQGLGTGSSPTFAGLTVPTINGVKVYRALLTQAGSSGPVATVLENSLGGTIAWGRSTTGSYDGLLVGAFTSNKTMIFVGSSWALLAGSFSVIQSAWASSGQIDLRTWDVDAGTANYSDGILSKTEITILVFP